MRVDNWLSKLHQFVESRRRTPYQWGVNDCGTFSADAIEVVTGADPIADIRGQWTDEASAMQLLEANGGIVGLANRYFPGRRKEREMAQEGDLVLVKVEGKHSLAICVGRYAAAPGDDGVLLTEMTEARAVWEV